MKKIGTVFIAVCISFVIFGCLPDTNSKVDFGIERKQEQHQEQKSQPQISEKNKNVAVLALFKEKKIRDLWWVDDTNTLRVFMHDDGTSRNGYAEYVCLVLSEHCVSKNMQVRIFSGTKPWGDKDLGSALCGESSNRDSCYIN